MDIDISKYLDELASIYKDIDRAYDEGAEHYEGFSCEGCMDNCCKNVFYHYTLIENLYFIEGFLDLPDDISEQGIGKAKDYVKVLGKNPFKEIQLSMMCPMNFEEKCEIYEHRPLICRIHGLPAVLYSPKGTQKWEGCWRFGEQHGDRIDFEIDRTAFYTRLASLERDLREEMSFMQKHKKTIAEMIVDLTKDEITVVKKISPGDFHKDSHII